MAFAGRGTYEARGGTVWKYVGVMVFTLGMVLNAAIADSQTEIKALQDAKALLDAQAARDAAEAAAIKAATELSKAKAAARLAEADIQKTQAAAEAKAVLDAKAAQDTSEAAAIKAETDLIKARAAASNVSSEIQRNRQEAAAALTKAQVSVDTALVDALKGSFGAPPSVGSDGNVTMSDATQGMLLQVKAGSLLATWRMAEELCTVLKAANVTNAFIPPSELDSKIQSASLVLRELNSLVERVRLPANRKLVGLDGAEAQVAPAAALSAVSLLQYGAGALQTIARLFKSDYTVGLASDATRVAWLEYFMVAKCPEQVPAAQIEAVVRSQSLASFMGQLNELMDFYVAATAKKASTSSEIEQTKARIAAVKAEKGDVTVLEGRLESLNGVLKELAPLDVWLPRIQALLTAVATTPAPFLDALTWSVFGDANHSLKIPSRPRLSVVLTTQDAQITKSFWLTGKTVYGRSAGELIYRVVTAEGKVVTVGYLTAISPTNEIEVGKTTNEAIDATHHRP